MYLFLYCIYTVFIGQNYLFVAIMLELYKCIYFYFNVNLLYLYTKWLLYTCIH